MPNRLKPALRALKSLYDRGAVYTLAAMLLLSSWSIFWYLLVWALASLCGLDSVASFWRTGDRLLPISTLGIRLALFCCLNGVLLWRLRPRLTRWHKRLRRYWRAQNRRYRRWARHHPHGCQLASAGLTVGVTLVLIPFVLQPTLVSGRWSARSWSERAANLLDGQATAALGESVIGLYRRVLATPSLGERVSDHAFDASEASGPMMNRWDRLIWDTVGTDHRGFALVKAVLWVESGGRQFAVSSTGCAGLMQFCTATARAAPFRQIFGMGNVYPCDCTDSCHVPMDLQRALEAGSLPQIKRQRRAFVCDLTDARFDAKRAIAAGWHYLRELQQLFAGNIVLTYVAYNSGPQVAVRVRQKLSGQRAALADIGRHLTTALRPTFGKDAPTRARSLLQNHLPKLLRAFERYLTLARSA